MLLEFGVCSSESLLRCRLLSPSSLFLLLSLSLLSSFDLSLDFDVSVSFLSSSFSNSYSRHYNIPVRPDVFFYVFDCYDVNTLGFAFISQTHLFSASNSVSSPQGGAVWSMSDWFNTDYIASSLVMEKIQTCTYVHVNPGT